MRGAAGLLVLLLLALPVASAHAVLLSSDPPAGARLDDVPAEVRVTLTEPADPSGSSLHVFAGTVAASAPFGPLSDCVAAAPLDTSGAVDNGDVRFTEGMQPTMTVSLPADLPDGTYVLAWQALSRTDGHTTSGTVGFAIGDFDPGASRDAGSATGLCSIAGRAFSYLGFALAFGAALLAWRLAEPGLASHQALARRALAAGAVLHLVGVGLLLHATRVASDLDWSGVASSGVGRILLLRALLGLVAAAFALLALPPRSRTRTGPMIAVLALLGAGVQSARLGHASLTGLGGVAMDALHLVAGAAWAGGLVLVLAMLARAGRDGLTGDQVRALGLRFGTIALGCVLVVFATGVVVAVLILGAGPLVDARAAWHGVYRSLLSSKVLLALGMVALAAANRFVFLDPSPRPGPLAAWRARAAALGPDGSQRGLRRTIALEAAFGAGVLLLAAALTATSPPATAQPPSLDLAAPGEAFHYRLSILPPPQAGGTSDLVLRITDRATGDLVVDNTCGRDSCVEVRIAIGDGAAQRYVFEPTGEGTWSLRGVLWVASGDAAAHVRAQTAEVFEDAVDLAFHVA